MCGDHHLPKPGGVLDQDYQLMATMRTLKNVYDTVVHMRSLVGDEINTRLSVQQRVLIGELRKMGAFDG